MLVNGNVGDQLHAVEADSVLDVALYNLENGVEIALHRAQLWSKFAKDLVNFIDKRTAICEFSFTAAISCSISSLLQQVNCWWSPVYDVSFQKHSDLPCVPKSDTQIQIVITTT